MKAATIFIRAVAFCCMTLATVAIAPQSILGRTDFSVPVDPMSYFKASPEQEAAWQRAKRECTPIDFPEIFENQECNEALTAYFLNEPVWAYSQLNYYDRKKGLLPLPIKVINSRPSILPYSYADLQAEDIPRWHDIFDGEIAAREDTALDMATNPKCKELSEHTSLGLQPEMAKQCAARELFKYATYLDGCFVALQRVNLLINVPGLSGILENKSGSTYSNVQEIIKEKITDKTEQKHAIARFEKGFLHAVWMNSKCNKRGYVMLPDVEVDETIEFPKTLFWQPGMVKMYQSINVTHDIILKIAAKSGDHWALQSYPLGILTSSEFNEDVQKEYPILFHRHLGSPTGWFRSELTVQEQAQHRAQAYLMLKDKLGVKKASLEYDPAELEEEIKFVSAGHKLKFPRSRTEIFKEYDED